MLSAQPPLWSAQITTPAGLAKNRRQALAALVANGIRGTGVLEEDDPSLGLWLVGFPVEMTAGWEDRENETIEIRSPRGGFLIEVTLP